MELKRFFTGKPCKRGHVVERLISSGTCIECIRLYKRSHPEYQKAVDARRSGTEYRRKQKAKSERIRRQRDDVKAARRAERMKRLADTRHRTPPWSNIERIKEIYQDAQKMGPNYHVDHIVPLNGRTVSGLHVPENLQIIPAMENLLKGPGWN